MRKKEINIGEYAEMMFHYIKREVIIEQKILTDELRRRTVEKVEIPPCRNPSQFEAYRDSIEMADPQVKGNVITSNVHSYLKVGGNNPKWVNVPVGAFLEWGTGPMGESSNEYPHGYPYTTDEPWDMYSLMQYGSTGTWGITARPHFLPAANEMKPIIRERLKGAVVRTWKKYGK